MAEVPGGAGMAALNAGGSANGGAASSANGGLAAGGAAPNPGGAANAGANAGAPGGAGNSGGNGAATWYDAAHQALVTQKGWTSPNDAITSYANLETLLGEKATAIVPPKADATPEDWGKFYERLGRPADPSMYKFNKDGMNPALVTAASKWFHEQGLNDRQAEGVLKAYNEFASQSDKTTNTNWMSESSNQLADLQTEWGSKFDDNVELARRATQFAMKEAGLSPDQLNQFERAVGTKTMLTMMQKFGNMFKEAANPGGQNGAGFNSSPDWAKSRIGELRADPTFRTRYFSDDPTIRNAAIEEMNKLNEQAFGNAPIK